MATVKPRVRKIFFIFAGLIIMAGIYSGLLALCNQYLRDNGLLNPFSKTALLLILGFGIYRIYRLFCRQLNSLGGK